MSELELCQLGGVALGAINAIALLFYRESRTLGLASEALLEPARQEARQAAMQEQEPEAAQPASGGSAATAEPAVEGRGKVWCVPYLVAGSDLLFMLGSGMTVQFFPLFFKEVMQLGPVSTYGAWPPL